MAGVAAGAALLVCAPAPAAAQTVGDIPYLDAVDAWAKGQELRRLLPDSSAGATKPSKPKPRKRARPRRPTARQLAALRFERSAAVTQENIQAVVDLLEPGDDAAAVAAELQRALDELHADMGRSDVPVSPSNIADVAAWTLMFSYAAYYDRTSMADGGVRVVRDDARRSFALDRQARRLSDARAQQFTEVLELRTFVRVSDLYFGRKNGDDAREQAALEELSSWIEQLFGIDLAEVRFTRRGFVER